MNFEKQTNNNKKNPKKPFCFHCIKNSMSQALVAHACNLSYSGGRDRRIEASRANCS
jgi:hypothetical protein